MKRCPNCNAEYADSFKVCPRDGSRLDEGTVIEAQPGAQDQTVAVPPPAPQDQTMVVPPPSPAVTGSMIGTTIANRFRIVGKLGEGGMGSVWKAEHTKMDRTCAIKILGEHMINDPDALARFTREAQMSSRIDHPHAVTIYDYGESDDGLVYLAMEFIEGDTLSTVLKKEGRLPLERAARAARQIADALDAAHALNIVHRDLKPDNIMLARKGKDADFVKVLDFGIAKMAESEDKRQDLTQAGLVIGTPFYMSPEQVSGQKLDPRSDVYSFALIIYEMLAGSLPFGGENTQAVMISRLTHQPKPLRHANPAISESIEAVVMRGLVKDRDARTPSAGQLVTEFENAVLGRDAAATSPQVAAQTAAIEGGVYGATASALPTTPPVPAAPPYGAPAAVSGLDSYSTNRASAPMPPPPVGVAPTERVPMGAPAPPHGSYGAQPYVAAPPAKKGGAGKWIAIVVVLAILGIGAIAVIAGGVLFKDKIFGTDPQPTAGPGPGTPTTPTPTPANSEAYRAFQRGGERFKAEDMPGAIAAYREAISKQYQYPQAHADLGAALYETGKFEDAITELKIAIEQDPSPKGDVFFNLGLSYFKLKDYRSSADAFEKATTRGDDPLAHAYRGFALDNAGDKAGAREAYQKYLDKDPSGEVAGEVRQIMAGKSKAPTE